MYIVFYWKNLWGKIRYLCLPSRKSSFILSVNDIISTFWLKEHLKNIVFQKCPRSLCTLSCLSVGKSCIFSASLVCFMHLCTSQTQKGILDDSTCTGERNKPVSHGLSGLKWCRMDAIWQSHSLKSSLPPRKLGLFLAVPIFISKSVTIM